MRHCHVNLQPYLNSFGATYDLDRTDGVLNAWGNSFPAEEIPFCSILTVTDIPFHLPKKEEGAYDHIEALGQLITLPESLPACGIALLCCGEMGDQELIIEVCGPYHPQHNFLAIAKGWLTPADQLLDNGSYSCSHLHYIGGYELSCFRPVLWCFRYDWSPLRPTSSLRLGINPLFHIFALTLLLKSKSNR